MPIKLWGFEELLASADVNTYLMKQAVISCTSGTRPSSPQEGMTIYETDTDRYSSYTGAAWVTLGQTITSSHTPVLTSTGTNPALGSGNVAAGKYTLWGGKWCTYRGTIRFGTSGVNAGSGQYLISLPVASATALGAGVDDVGAGLVSDSPTNNIIQATFYIAGSGVTTMSGFASNAQITSTGPWTWSASDYMSWTITYETA